MTQLIVAYGLVWLLSGFAAILLVALVARFGGLFIRKMFFLQIKLMPKVCENGIYVSIISFAYAIISAQPRVLLASVLVWVVCLAYLAIREEEV